MDDNVIPEGIKLLLKKAARKVGIHNPRYHLNEKNEKGEIYFGEVYFIKIQDEKTEVVREVIVKRSSESRNVRHHYPVAGMYLNECQFYDTLWPSFVKFQEAAHYVTMYDEIPIRYATDATKFKEMIVLENLRFSNYQTVKNTTFLDKKHFELIFNRYGKFHGLSFAYKAKLSEPFDEMARGLHDYWVHLYKIKSFETSMITMFSECQQYLMLEAGNTLVEKFQEYVKKGCEGFTQCCKYSGAYAVIVHGDSCCNNLMFRYNAENEPTDLKFIDFQIVRKGCPVFDLSYCLYSGGTKEIFEELEHYLRIYHTSLSKTVEKYGCDGAKLYPYEELVKEWKTYSKFGFIMGLLLTKSKCITQEERVESSGSTDEPNAKKVVVEIVDTQAVKRRSLDLIKHMHKRGFL